MAEFLSKAYRPEAIDQPLSKYWKKCGQSMCIYLVKIFLNMKITQFFRKTGAEWIYYQKDWATGMLETVLLREGNSYQRVIFKYVKKKNSGIKYMLFDVSFS